MYLLFSRVLSSASKSSASPQPADSTFVTFTPSPSFKLCCPSATPLSPPAVSRETLSHSYPDKRPFSANSKKRKRKPSFPEEEQETHFSPDITNTSAEESWLSKPPNKKRQPKENGTIVASPVQEMEVARKEGKEGRAEGHGAPDPNLSRSTRKRKKRKKKKRLRQREEDGRHLLSPVNR